MTNLVNYFGKTGDIENIEVSPLLLQKGSAQLALFGLGSCRDERLHRLFRKGKVKFLRPKEEEGEWFNILVLHQNRLVSCSLDTHYRKYSIMMKLSFESPGINLSKSVAYTFFVYMYLVLFLKSQ